MYCPMCGKVNPNDAKECQFCKATLKYEIRVRVSRLAITAVIFALCGTILYLIPFFITFSSRQFSESSGGWISTALNIAFLLGPFMFIVSFLLGIVSIGRIEKSGGLITGRSFGIGAALIPIFCVCFSILFTTSPKSRGTPYRMICGTNLSGMGKAMVIYSNENDDQFPRAGGNTSVWANQILDWKASNRYLAYGLSPDRSGGRVTISSSLFLLVKYSEFEPKRFICKNDLNTKEFVPSKYGIRDRDVTQFWDFGPEPWKHCSYSYHMPYGNDNLSISSDPAMAVAADRNPWIAVPDGKVKDFKKFDPDGDRIAVNAGNTPSHPEAQNVLYLDIHVDQEKTPNCGVNDDNIYTSWDGEDIRRGIPPKLGSKPSDTLDSLLVNDPPIKKP
ncbi:MAG: hypothetical protein JW715_13340 [Sedimentisphaerales bacterium]|nr:hypothetical protein [Sedimentisphaerales bacterium]